MSTPLLVSPLLLAAALTAVPAAPASPAEPGVVQGQRNPRGSATRSTFGDRAAPPAPSQPVQPFQPKGPPSWWGKKKNQGESSPAGALLVGKVSRAKEDALKSAGGPDTGADEPILATMDKIRAWFFTADYDGSEWISFREAAAACALEREAFRVYDHDNDGRMLLGEFLYYYNDRMSRTGNFRDPIAKPHTKTPPKRTPEQLRNAYDRDLDTHINLSELNDILSDYRRGDVEAERVLGEATATTTAA